ncbi:HesA/MoeB/ThiF family protein [Xylanibacter muris]|uniref:HesA/MoeB/ThiF family protein n=1 Tax=Xylanibacter muris TaxID=2736290 RepID=A0ABX2AR88_9BACT|nr:HesA/MoeB/ThiF family protein [Xylanibacter muris]NPD93062.1 HesA/MoeB/ThiF family protein [Xylanibacter muris]
MQSLSEDERRRYSRHLLLDGIGEDGQLRIRSGKVLVVGAGGLGSPVLMYLAAAGVGTVGIVDGDVADLSNLQRQIIHSTYDAGRAKVESAREKMLAMNPGIHVDVFRDFLTPENAVELFSPYDFIVDATDNFPVKYLINDTCVSLGKPFSYGGLLGYGGQTFTHVHGTACFRCLFPEPPLEGSVPLCSEVGVLGPAVGVIGCIQASEVLKYFSGAGRLLTDSILRFNALTMDFNRFSFCRNAGCPVCGRK